MDVGDQMISAARKLWFETHKEEKREYDRLYRIKNKERIALKKAENVKNNPEKDRARKQRYKEAHREKVKEQARLYGRQNKEKRASYLQVYRQENAYKTRYWAMKRHTAKLQRTPKWLTEVDFERIENEYKLAALLSQLTKETWHVDHIVPLQGKNVSGLHVPSNLRAIRGCENISKNNSWVSK